MNKSEWFIKDPTVRKVKNRGWKPVWYHSDRDQRPGWIYKENGCTFTHPVWAEKDYRRMPNLHL